MSDETTQGVEPARVDKRVVPQPIASSTAARLLGQPVLLRQLYDVVVVLNGELSCVYALGQLAGRRDAELLGDHFMELLPGEAQVAFRGACARVRALGGRDTFELRRHEAQLSLQLLALEDEQGTPLIVVLQSLASESAHRERERDKRLRYAMEASGVGTWSWDRVTDTVAWDDGLCRIYGLAPGQSPRLYDDYVGYLHPEDRPRIEAQIGRCLETGVYEDFEHRLIRPDGEVRHVFCRGAAETNERGEVTGMGGGILDITDRKRLEEHLRHVQKMEAFGQLAAGIAHNFNNLLSVVLPNAELCRLHAPASLLLPLADIEHAASRASEMVRQLMLFARHEASEQKVAVDLTEVAGRTLNICRSTFDRRITIELFAEDRLPLVHARAGEIEQVLLNICINARDALEEAPNDNPRIELRLERTSGSRVLLSVSDNGPGMDEATRVRLFEPFFTTKEVGRGTGLGLASAYGILLDHQGLIRCRSARGKGTVFTIELPVARDAAPPVATPGVLPSTRGDETILLIDDEPLVRRALSALLEHAGFKVLQACDGLEGLAVVDASPSIDLILLDRSMPQMSGEELLAELRVRRPNLPVILLTGQPGPDVEVSGPFTAMTKPPRSAALLSTVRRMLDESVARAQ